MKKRLEEDGVYTANPEHWEFFNTPVFVYINHSKYKEKYYTTMNTNIRIPNDVVRHLNLQNKERIDIAIRRPRRKEEKE